MPLTPEQEERLNEILRLGESPRLNQWEKNFFKDLSDRYAVEGPMTIVSSKMWLILIRIEDKILNDGEPKQP